MGGKSRKTKNPSMAQQVSAAFFERSTPMFVCAVGSLLTGMAGPTPAEEGGAANGASYWNEVDFFQVDIDDDVVTPKFTPYAFTAPQLADPANMAKKKEPVIGVAGTDSCQPFIKSIQVVSETPIEGFATAVLGDAIAAAFATTDDDEEEEAETNAADPFANKPKHSDDVSSSGPLPVGDLWHGTVTAHFKPRATLLDMTKASLRTQLELIAVEQNLTVYDLLSSPIVVPAHPKWRPLVLKLRLKVLPSLITRDAVDAALKRGVGMTGSEMTWLKPNKQVEGTNIGASIHAATEGNERIVFMRAKGFCFGLWVIMRGLLHTITGAERSMIYFPSAAAGTASATAVPLSSANSADTSSTLGIVNNCHVDVTNWDVKVWRNEFILEGLLAMMITLRPTLFKLSIASCVKVSAMVTPINCPLDEGLVRAAAAQLWGTITEADHDATFAANKVDGNSNSGAEAIQNIFPILPFIRAVVDIRKGRGVVKVCGPLMPPMYCDQLLMTVVKVMSSNAASCVSAAVKNGTLADPKGASTSAYATFCDEAVNTLNRFLEEVAEVAGRASGSD